MIIPLFGRLYLKDSDGVSALFRVNKIRNVRVSKAYPTTVRVDLKDGRRVTFRFNQKYDEVARAIRGR